MFRHKVPLLLALALLLAGAVVLSSRPLPGTAGSPAPLPERSTPPASHPPASSGAGLLARPPADGREAPTRDGSRAELIAALRARFGARLDEPSMQMKLLEQLMRHFQQRDPSGWEQALVTLLREAFPERAGHLARLLGQRVAYGRWMEEHHAALRDKPAAERRAAVWAERHRLFGQDVAEQLWQGEVRAQAVADALATIDALPEASVGERLARYQESVTRTYGEDAPGHQSERQQELMNRFLDMGSVQRDLGAMTPEQRAVSLRDVRQGMGLDEAALERWKELDVRRDARWELGTRYMAERALLAGGTPGAGQDARLAELRTRYFPDEAATLAEEEAGGFFRFGQARRWGRE